MQGSRPGAPRARAGRRRLRRRSTRRSRTVDEREALVAREGGSFGLSRASSRCARSPIAVAGSPQFLVPAAATKSSLPVSSKLAFELVGPGIGRPANSKQVDDAIRAHGYNRRRVGLGVTVKRRRVAGVSASRAGRGEAAKTSTFDEILGEGAAAWSPPSSRRLHRGERLELLAASSASSGWPCRRAARPGAGGAAARCVRLARPGAGRRPADAVTATRRRRAQLLLEQAPRHPAPADQRSPEQVSAAVERRGDTAEVDGRPSAAQLPPTCSAPGGG